MLFWEMLQKLFLREVQPGKIRNKINIVSCQGIIADLPLNRKRFSLTTITLIKGKENYLLDFMVRQLLSTIKPFLNYSLEDELA